MRVIFGGKHMSVPVERLVGHPSGRLAELISDYEEMEEDFGSLRNIAMDLHRHLAQSKSFSKDSERSITRWLSRDAYKVSRSSAPLVLQVLFSGKYNVQRKTATSSFDKEVPRTGYMIDGLRELYREFIADFGIEEQSKQLIISPVHGVGHNGLYGIWNIFANVTNNFHFVLEQYKDEEGTRIIPQSYLVKGDVTAFLSLDAIKETCARNDRRLGTEEEKHRLEINESINLRDFGKAYEKLIEG